MPVLSRTLSCGTPALIEVISGVRSAALSWYAPGGVADEPADRLGLSAVWSELFMRGSRDLDSRQQADAFDRLGCSRSADAGTYFMRFAATMMGERLADVLPLFVDMARRPRFDESSLEPARDLALQALESIKDDPQERCALGARRRHYPAPLNRASQGSQEGLKAITLDDVTSVWARTPGPKRSIFAAAGAVDPDRLCAQLDALLSDWKGGTPEPPTTGQAVRGYDHETDQTNQVQVLVLHDAPPERHPDSLLEKIVTNVLSGGMSGRLFTEVREKRGLCYSVSAGYRGERDFGAVSAYVGTTPERAQESLDVLHGELERINTPAGQVTKDEFDRALIGMKSRLVFSGESTGARAGALTADYHRLGFGRTLTELAGAIDKVTLDQVNAYLARRTLGTLTIQTLGPSPLKPPAA